MLRNPAPARPVALRPALPQRCRTAPHRAPARPRGAVRPTAAFQPHGLLAQVADAAAAVGAAAPEAVLSPEEVAAAAAAAQLAANKSGFLGTIANALEGTLEAIDGVLSGAHVPYSYGFSIIVLTLLVKVVTFPLSRKQIESTSAMQALQPKVKDLQARYANDTERLQRETARLYQEAGVNPLAGCLPTLATLPVFIGLYRALTNAASDGLLTDGFFWIPSLGGPSSMGDNASGRGLGWLFPLVDGAPPVGWHDAGAYLVLPVLLVASQFASQRIMQPPQASADPSQASANAILKFLPFMLGWFSLNVPSGLTLYWIVNNILTTAQTVYLRGAVAAAATAGAPAPPLPSMAEGMRAAAARPPPNPPALSDASRAVVDVEVVAGGSPAPGARFAALKEAEKRNGRQRRQGGGSSAPKVAWSKEEAGEPKA